MTEAEAIEIAENYLRTKEMRGFRAVVAGARKNERVPDQWSVLFSLFTPEDFLLDGPMIIVVDEKTGEAKSCKSP